MGGCGHGIAVLRARWYSPAQARFTQVDPFPGIPTLPGSQHPYSYALNNPVNYTDPSGEIVPIVAAILIGGLIGAAIAGGSYAWNHRDLSECEPFNDSDFWAAVASGFVGGAQEAAAVRGGICETGPDCFPAGMQGRRRTVPNRSKPSQSASWRQGDCVESVAGVCREIERTRVAPGSITVYNFTVESARTYFIGTG